MMTGLHCAFTILGWTECIETAKLGPPVQKLLPVELVVEANVGFRERFNERRTPNRNDSDRSPRHCRTRVLVFFAVYISRIILL